MKLLFWKKPKEPKAPKHDHHQDLVFRFKDLDGINYFGWPDDSAVSIERLSKMGEFGMYMAKGLSMAHYHDYLDQLEKANLEYVADTKKAKPGLVNAIIYDMRQHAGRICTIDVYYNYLAIFYIRQDEKLDGFSQQIQDEKVKAFEKAANDRHSFFFRLPELKKLQGFMNFTSENWHELVSLSALLEKQHQEKMKLYSGQRSVNTAKKKESS